VLAGDTSQLLLQRSVSLTTFTTLSSATQTWIANKWYRVEVAWGTGGLITGRLYDSDGLTLLNTVKAIDNVVLTGGIAFRSTGTYFVDTAQKVGAGIDDDWYSFNVTNTTSLRLETSTPADGANQFVNTLSPHLELYDSSNAL